ncbi:hypothetical protein FJ492_11290 [Mesorhizobium sp. B2-5-4]|uniref:hypothetical protein n=1 Tax=unclassified Mesorhizobium TaxID=325217 RepID=UPI00112E59D8|nr:MULTISPECIES: hypothetical protein [unclassified Mesorhizobium]TPJ39965.1 hypothetical protein FJ432_17215 [Mesorhizobium sp. B2-6-5]TPJ88059.1 hypothetical protein FJ434_11185 [Mesorhizobium sp. B2-5-13]TPK44824.1 hypothetical protein FJ492_11290 [Mesorhizobium sp. B2-5-4]TPK52254.1 hypothetical protein FJ560_06600 [Mesorhizobium sp. B2-5-5]TPL82608.1 hypothetical protein FJ941_13410 [Mesorhizobium sp. B2-3-13]
MSQKHRDLDYLIQHYIECRRGKPWPLSVSAAVVAIRTVFRGCLASDYELATLIARAAVSRGQIVDFDLNEPAQAA